VESLTLAEREAVNSVVLRCQDRPGEPWYCFGCLADLPSDPKAQGAHRCGEPAPGPGDLVWYCGPVPEGHGRLYEVTRARGGRLDLRDCGLGLRGAPAYEAVVVRAAEGEAA